MIYDSLNHLSQYLGIHKNLDTALQYLASHDLSKLPLGRLELDGEEAYLMVSDVEYHAPEEGRYEAHRDYADVQLSLTGGESVGYLPLEALKEWEDYQPDIVFARENPPGLELPLEQGRFVVLFPQDAHRPGVGQGKGRKIVVKIRM